MKKKFFNGIIALVLSLAIVFSSTISSFAALDAAGIIGIITGTGSGNVNLSQAFAEFLKNATQDESDSVIDKFVQNLKDKINGTDTTEPDVEDSVTIDAGAAVNIADLFNLTVNEIKKGTPEFTKVVTATMDQEIASSLKGGLGVVTSLVESLIGTKDLFAGAISGVNRENQITTKYPSGNDIINNVSVSGKDYVSCLTADDIKDYSITIYRSGAYKMHIDLKDVEGSAAQSGLAHVFDTTDKAFATLEIGTTSININTKLKYVNNYVECQVDRSGNLVSFSTHMGITFLFKQDDGSYSSEMPYLGVDFQEEGIIYIVDTEYSAFDYSTRLMGDANNDGKVNSTDARNVLRVASKLEVFDEVTMKYCDVNGDGKITAYDSREILRASAKLVTLPTAEEALGVKPYVRDESVDKQIDDLLILIMAYQAAQDKAEQDALQDSYDQKYNGTDKEEPTTGELNNGNKVDDVIDFIGNIIGKK